MHNMVHGEILKAVFPLLKGTELAKCMLVCKQWRDIAQDDYFWKRLCSEQCPSVGKGQSPPTLTYYQLFKNFINRSALTPRLSFNDLEFYIDIWVEGKIIFSHVVPGPVVQKGTLIPPPGISKRLRYYLERPDYKMILPVKPTITVPMNQLVSVSVLVGRKDTRKAAWIVRSIGCKYQRQSYNPLASEYLNLSYPLRLFICSQKLYVSLLCLDGENMEVGYVFGIEMNFGDAASTEDKVLLLLDMLDWK